MKSEPNERDEGAPVPRDAIDPELVKLARTRMQIGLLTALGVVVLCVVFLLRLGPDRSFAGQSEPRSVSVADVLAGAVEPDTLVTLEAEPLVAHALRAMKKKGDLGTRFIPVRGSGDRLWLVLPGDSREAPRTDDRYVGRLRRLDDSRFGVAVAELAAEQPRWMFATPAAIRAAFASSTLRTVTDDDVRVAATDRVAFEVVEPDQATLVVTFGSKRKDARAWLATLAAAQLPATELPAKDTDAALGQARFRIAQAPDEVSRKLVEAELFATRVEPVTTRHETTWGELARSPSAGLAAGAAVVPDAHVDAVGILVARPIPDAAYAVFTTEQPADYWYVMPITVVLIGLGLLFAWALVRAVRRDLLPVRGG
jgi:hypothetical protein